MTVRRVGDRRMVVSVAADDLPEDDIWLRVAYVGDRVEAFIGGKLVADHFYFGQPWDLGLRQFADRLRKDDLVFVFHPLTPDAPFLADLPDAVQAEMAKRSTPLLTIENPVVQPEYRTQVTFRH